MSKQKRGQRAMTIAEVLASFTILMLILSFITLMFHQAFTHATLTAESMTNEQLARLAMGKISESLSQASVDTDLADDQNYNGGNTILPIEAQTATSIAFFRVDTLVPAALAVLPPPNNAPDPTYEVHVISWDPVTQQITECWSTLAIYKTTGCTAAKTVVLATNVSNMTIAPVNTGVSSQEYQFQLTLNNVLNATQAESPYTLVDNVDVMFKS
jgi:hypothetical protein